MTTKPAPLIVAVEPDATQAKQLASMARRYLRGEFVVESTAQAALKALGDRVPDLILTPVLLSSRDETLLIEHLRGLGAAAAHVQTLGIPILSSSEPTIRERGSRLMRRRQRAEAEHDGCELSVFADQVQIYLERAATERAAAEHQAPRGDGVAEESPVVNAAVAETIAEPAGGTVEPIEPVAVFEAPPVTTPVDQPIASIPVASIEEDTYEEWLPMEALETELGLASTPGQAPPLWRVTPGASDSPAVVDEPARVSAVPPLPTPMPARRRSRPSRPSQPLDDWAYFDPTQSGFQALIRKLDEIAAQYLAAEMAAATGLSSARL
jgi:hypothetical protein